jgi:hypothetical protein
MIQDQRSLLTLMMKINGPGVVRGFLFIADSRSPLRVNRVGLTMFEALAVYAKFRTSLHRIG